ncbi:MAG TPA: hypothetical protein VMF04_05065 [Thermoplasmata archaeon]|nr:hypothetical protein [Thermoplasmata archaeon]
MLSVSDLEINVLEFRQRSFQFQRVVAAAGRDVALFSRTETETESRFRPQLVHLHLLVPPEWVVYDEPNDILLISRDGATIPVRLSEQVVEVGSEPPEFEEQGIAWKRVPRPSGGYVYAPAELADALLTPAVYAAVGLT